jgi:hypothetical protein
MSKPQIPATKSTIAPAKARSESVEVALTAATLAAVDSWAAQHKVSQADAVARLVKLGLTVTPAAKPARAARNDRAVELAAKQIGRLIDPDAPSEERDRRIARLTEGPPEFVEARVDLPKRRR